MIDRIIGGRYKIIKEIGGGAFGTTYLAEDIKRPGNPYCVVKHFTPINQEPELLKKAEELFEREAKILEQLGKHPQIPQLLAHIQENQDFFIVQEYIEGNDITKELPPGVPISEDFVIKLLIDILEVLVVIHEHGDGVIHRDLKPSNIRRRTEDNKIVIIDFGAVKEIKTQKLGNQPPRNPTVIGTPGYTPPEQANGNPVLSSDIYAVGIIGIQALTGIQAQSLPIDSRSGKIIWRDKIKVSNKLANCLDKMVKYSHQERYPTAKLALAEVKKISTPKLPNWLKIILLTLIPTGLIILIFLLSRIEKPECGGKLATYQNNEKLINLEYPECWNLDETPSFVTGKFLTLNQPETSTKIIFNSSEFPDTLQQLRDITIKDIERNLASAKILNIKKRFILNKTGIEIIATGEVGGEEIKNMYVMTLSNNIAYVINYSAPKDDFDKFLKTAETIIKSLEIK